LWNIDQTHLDKLRETLPVGGHARFAEAIVRQIDALEARALQQQRYERAELRVRERAARERDRLDCRHLQ